MSKTRMLIALVGIVAVSFAVTWVTAHPWASSTPLYTLRMEQASSKMNFLPTEMNTFTYTAETKYTLNCDVRGCGSVGGSEIMATGDECVSVFPTSACSSCMTCDSCINCPTETPTCANPTECGINTCKETQCDRTCYACG